MILRNPWNVPSQPKGSVRHCQRNWLARNPKPKPKTDNQTRKRIRTGNRNRIETGSLHVMRIPRCGADRSRRAWSVIAILELSVIADAARSGGKTLTGPNLVARPAGGRARWKVAEGTPEWAWNNISKTLKLGNPSKIFFTFPTTPYLPGKKHKDQVNSNPDWTSITDFTFHNYHNFQNTVDSLGFYQHQCSFKQIKKRNPKRILKSGKLFDRSLPHWPVWALISEMRQRPKRRQKICNVIVVMNHDSWLQMLNSETQIIITVIIILKMWTTKLL